MLANVIAFVLTIVSCVVMAVMNGGQVSNIGVMLTAVTFFGMARAHNQGKAHAPKGEAVSAPILENSPETNDGEEQDVTEPSCSEQAVAETADEVSSAGGSGITVGDGCIGRVVDGRLMLTRDEINQVIADCTRFANVVPVQRPAGKMNPGSELKCFLVLSQDSAVFFDLFVKQVWTVNPSGLSLKRHPLSNAVTGLIVESVDGRRETVQNFPAKWPLLCAWMSDSADVFDQQPDFGEALLAHEILTGHSFQPVLRWTLPYADVRSGIKQVERDPARLPVVLRHQKLKLFRERLMSLGLEEGSSPLMQALADEQHRCRRNNKLALIIFGCVMTSLGVLAGYSSRAITGKAAAVMALLLAVVTVAGIVKVLNPRPRHAVTPKPA